MGAAPSPLHELAGSVGSPDPGTLLSDSDTLTAFGALASRNSEWNRTHSRTLERRQVIDSARVPSWSAAVGPKGVEPSPAGP